MSNIHFWGVGAFGVIIGWSVFYISRHRKSEAQFTDLGAVLTAITGSAVTAIFGSAKSPELLGAYGMGLFVGFFGYAMALRVLVIGPGEKSPWLGILDRTHQAASPGDAGTSAPGSAPPGDSLAKRVTALEESVKRLELAATPGPVKPG